MSIICDQLVAEVVTDSDLALPVEGDMQRTAAVKEVSTAVKKHVGQQFAVWKKERARCVAATGDS